MFPAGSRVIALKTLVAGGEGLSMPKEPDTDPTSRFFIHAELGDEGEIVVDHAKDSALRHDIPSRPEIGGWRSKYDARWAVRFKRTDSVHYCDPSEITAWRDYPNAKDAIIVSSLNLGINSIAAHLGDDDLWQLVSTVPHDDHHGAHDFAHEKTYATLAEAQAAAETAVVAEHLAAWKAHHAHQHERSEIEKRHASISELDAQIEIEKRKHEILRLQLEQAEMQAKLDALTKKKE